jgi:hypothetical protein
MTEQLEQKMVELLQWQAILSTGVFTYSQAAKYLRISKAQLISLVKRGDLSVCGHNEKRIARIEIDSYLRRNLKTILPLKKATA